MLYLFQVYALVVVAVLLPFLLLYLAVALSRLALSGVPTVVRGLKNVSAIRTGYSKEHWSLLLRQNWHELWR